MRKALWCWPLVLACAAHAQSPPIIEGGDRVLVAQWDAFDVEVSNRVSAVCLPQPARLKAVAASGLDEHGFRVTAEMVPAVVRISVFGHEAAGACVVIVDTQVMTFERILVPNSRSIVALKGEVGTTVTKRHVDIGSSLLSGPDAAMQARLEQAVRQHMTHLYWQVQLARDYAFAAWPEIERAWSSHRARARADVATRP